MMRYIIILSSLLGSLHIFGGATNSEVPINGGGHGYILET